MLHVNESWNTWMSHGTREWVMLHTRQTPQLPGIVLCAPAMSRYTWISHVTCHWVMEHMNESWLICRWIMSHMTRSIRPTQSVKYVPLQLHRFAQSIFPIVQYRNFKSCSGDFYSSESDPPHKIMRYRFYYSFWLGFPFPPDGICQVEMICIGGVPVSKRHFGGAGP